MAEIGAISLYVALALAIYAVIGSVVGKLRTSPALLESARYSIYVVPVVLFVATLTLVLAFLRADFRIEYVAEHSNLVMDGIYTWVAIYAGNEGSLLYIAFVYSILGAAAMAWMPSSLRESKPYSAAILMTILVFLLGVMATLANPFDTLNPVPPDGQGINPLLTHPGMFFHPPMLMAGLISIAIPFSVVMGQMISGRMGDEWVDFTRVWSLVAWAVLGVGLLLGSWWAYTILGWGGYWAWDPIENVALMPWLTLTAFVHSIMVQKRRGMFRMWNVVLMNIAFTLGLFGIFINRGGPVPSVHSFASSELGWVFLSFLGIALLFSFGLFLFRYKSLKGMVTLESTLSREAAFLLNNLLLLGVAFVTLWGVVYPLISQLFQGVTVTVGAPFYNVLNGPLLLAIILLMGIGPLMPWRHASTGTLLRAVRIPGMASVMLASLLLIFGIRNVFAVISFSFCGLVATSIFQEWIRGTMVRHRHGENYVTGFYRLIVANRPRYGGYVVHLSIIMLTLGITGSAFFGEQMDVNLAPGESISIRGYNIEYQGETTTSRSDRTEFFNDLLVTLPSGQQIGMTPWRAFYPDHQMASTRAAIRSTPLEDLYIVSSESLRDGRVVFRILLNPLVWWMWVSGAVFVGGTVVALWPQRELLVREIPVHEELSTEVG